MSKQLKVLKRALKLFKEGAPHPDNGICEAILNAGEDLGLYAVAEDLTREISRRLGKNLFLYDWLYSKGHITLTQRYAFYWRSDNLTNSMTCKLKLTRIAWLEALIKEYECKPTKKSSQPLR